MSYLYLILHSHFIKSKIVWLFFETFYQLFFCSHYPILIYANVTVFQLHNKNELGFFYLLFIILSKITIFVY